MAKWCGDGFLGYGYDKVRMSCVGGRGELVVWLVKFAWMKACVKSGLPVKK